VIVSDILQRSKAAEQASQTAAISQQELANIGLSVFNILPSQLASTASDLKEVLNESFGAIAEDQQMEKLERRHEIQRLRESIEEQGQKYASLEISLRIQQRMVLDTLESCIQAHLESLFEGLRLKDASVNEFVDVGGASQQNDEGTQDNDASTKESAEVEDPGPQHSEAEPNTNMGLFIGIAAGLHMLGCLMSGVMISVVRPPSTRWATSGSERFDPIILKSS
jgi:hypothetical protein